MKKILVSTLVFSLALSPLAQAQQVMKEEMNRTLGQNVDEFVMHAGNQMSAALNETAKTGEHLDRMAVKTELETLKLQMKAYQGAKAVKTKNETIRYVVAFVGGGTVAGLGTYAGIKAIAAGATTATFLRGAVKSIFGMGVFIASFALAGSIANVAVMTHEQLHYAMAATQARINQLEIEAKK